MSIFQHERTPSTKRMGIKQIPLLPVPYAAASGQSVLQFTPEGSALNLSKSSFLIPPPKGWIKHIHPQGWLYYTNPSRRVVTDFKIETQDGQDQLRVALGEDEVLEGEQLPAHCEVWVNEGTVSEKPERMYVDHQERTVTVVPPKRGFHPARRRSADEDSDKQMKRKLRSEQNYFYFLKDHPCHTGLPDHAAEDAIMALSYFCHDRTLHAEESVVPYSKQTSQELLSLLQSMLDNEIFSEPRCEPAKVHLVSDILEHVAGERLRQHYGLQDARVYLNAQLHARPPKDIPPSLPIRVFWSFCMAILCFGAPFAYLRYIDEMFITGFGRTDTTTERWHRFVRENVKDWNGTNLVATVLISAAVAFLAVPGIDSVSRCLGLVSVLVAVASIVIGLLNVWQHQHESRTSPELTIIMDFFQQAEQGVHSFNLLATLLSLPLVLLIWATITFAVSIVTFAWRGVDTTAIDAGGGNSESQTMSSFLFGMPTAWVTTGVFIGLIVTVLSSFYFFWKVWTPPHISSKTSR